MPKLNRCPRCAARRVDDRRYCPNCAFDYAQGAGPALPHPDARSVRSAPQKSGETGVVPAVARMLDSSVVSNRDRDADVGEIRRDVARVALARHSIDIRSRIGGCLGMIVGLLIGSVVLPLLAGSNPIALLLLIGLFVWVGAYIGAWLVVRSIAR